MNGITRIEYNYLIKLLEKEQGNYETRDVEIRTAKVDKTDIYFLQQKLEKLRDKYAPDMDNRKLLKELVANEFISSNCLKYLYYKIINQTKQNVKSELKLSDPLDSKQKRKMYNEMFDIINVTENEKARSLRNTTNAVTPNQ